MTENQRLLSDGETPSRKARVGGLSAAAALFVFWWLAALVSFPLFFSQVLKSGLWGKAKQRRSVLGGTGRIGDFSSRF